MNSCEKSEFRMSPSASPVTIVRIIRIRVRAPRIVAAVTIRGGRLVEKKNTVFHKCSTLAFVRLLLLLQLLLSTKNLTSRELKVRELFAFLLTKNFFAFEPLQRMI